jgi:hypothetical protein
MVFDRRRRRAKNAPLTASKLRKKEASMRPTALPAELAPVQAPPLVVGSGHALLRLRQFTVYGYTQLFLFFKTLKQQIGK